MSALNYVHVIRFWLSVLSLIDCCHVIEFRINNGSPASLRWCRRDQVVTWSTTIWPTLQSSGFLHTTTSMSWIRTPTLLGLRLDPSPTSARIMRGNGTRATLKQNDCHMLRLLHGSLFLTKLRNLQAYSVEIQRNFFFVQKSKEHFPLTELVYYSFIYYIYNYILNI